MDTKVVKYIELFEYFEKEILNGNIIPGEKLPTEQEIVNKFSVSRHTVRQAISELEKKGYIIKEKSRGAFCCDIKSKPNKSNLVVVMITYITDYIFPYIIKGIEEELSKEGYNILLLSTNNQKEREAEHLKTIMDYNVVGAIIEPTASATKNTNIEYYKKMNEKQIPYIMINAEYSELETSSIVVNDEKGGYYLCKHLLHLGHKRIAGIFKEDDTQGIKRKKGYLKALSEENIEVNNNIIGMYKNFEQEFYPYAFAKNILSRKDRPTAIVCYNDNIAMQVIKAARELGLNIPDDISIVGYDNDLTIASALDFGLTTTQHPKENMGRLAATSLLNIINNKESRVNYNYEPELIIKDSTKRI